jgi:hypothetical protein
MYWIRNVQMNTKNEMENKRTHCVVLLNHTKYLWNSLNIQSVFLYTVNLIMARSSQIVLRVVVQMCVNFCARWLVSPLSLALLVVVWNASGCFSEPVSCQTIEVKRWRSKYAYIAACLCGQYTQKKNSKDLRPVTTLDLIPRHLTNKWQQQKSNHFPYSFPITTTIFLPHVGRR